MKELSFACKDLNIDPISLSKLLTPAPREAAAKIKRQQRSNRILTGGQQSET